MDTDHNCLLHRIVLHTGSALLSHIDGLRGLFTSSVYIITDKSFATCKMRD